MLLSNALFTIPIGLDKICSSGLLPDFVSHLW